MAGWWSLHCQWHVLPVWTLPHQVLLSCHDSLLQKVLPGGFVQWSSLDPGQLYWCFFCGAPSPLHPTPFHSCGKDQPQWCLGVMRVPFTLVVMSSFRVICRGMVVALLINQNSKQTVFQQQQQKTQLKWCIGRTMIPTAPSAPSHHLGLLEVWYSQFPHGPTLQVPPGWTCALGRLVPSHIL